MHLGNHEPSRHAHRRTRGFPELACFPSSACLQLLGCACVLRCALWGGLWGHEAVPWFYFFLRFSLWSVAWTIVAFVLALPGPGASGGEESFRVFGPHLPHPWLPLCHLTACRLPAPPALLLLLLAADCLFVFVVVLARARGFADKAGCLLRTYALWRPS